MFAVLLLFPVTGQATLTVTKIPGPPALTDVIVSQTLQDTGGNTRFRNYPESQRQFSGPIYGSGFDAVIREDMPAQATYPEAHRYRTRDRDLGQVFTVPVDLTGPIFLQAVSLRVGPTNEANQGGAGGARVSMQLFEVTGTPVINFNGTSGSSKARWDTFDTNRATTDDYVDGVTYTPITLASGGVLPADIAPNNYMRWELSGNSMIALQPGRQYAWMVMFDDPGLNRGLALANRNTAAWQPPIPFGPMPGGWAIRRDGMSNDFYDVMFDPNNAADMEIGRQSAIFPTLLEDRLHIAPSTLGYPDVDTYRDFVFWIHTSSIPEPASFMLLGLSGIFLLGRPSSLS